MPSCDVITKTLYRQLLRTTKPFASTNNGPVLCSLLHRSGLDDDFIEFTSLGQQQRQSKQHMHKQDQKEKQKKPSPAKEDTILVPSSMKDVHLSTEEARDLSRSYDELREIHFEREKYSTHTFGTNNPDDEGVWSTFPYYSYDDNNRSPHAVLYKQMLFHLFTMNQHQHGHIQEDGHSKESRYRYTSKHMIFPSQTIASQGNKKDCAMGERLVNIIRKEFRAKNTNTSNDNDDNKNEMNREKIDEIEDTNISTFSQFYDDSVRKEAGFLALREIQKKLSWAESMGMKNLFQRQQNRSQNHVTKEGTNTDTGINTAGDDDSARINAAQNALVQGVHKIPTYPPSSYLQSGAFLIAHPMLTGVFSKSVICILQHTDDSYKRPRTKTPLSGSKLYEFGDDNGNDNGNGGEGNESKDNGDKGETKDDNEIIPNLHGGTYGLIINSKLKVGVPDQNSNRRRDRTLREVMRHDSLPEGVKIAFGDCPVRNGGPVNLSIQMLRIASPDEEEKLKIGGTVLPMVLSDGHDDGVNDNDDGKGKKVLSSAMYSDKAIYFGGDIIKAAQAVIDGEVDRDSFSFVIGASCWETGQLEGEIERGYWLPFSCPTTIAHTGTFEHEGDVEKEQPVRRGKSDLWLSTMNSLGLQEGRLASFINEIKGRNEDGDACDEV
mmetsp:Transcript_3790/g.5477  ORF Transcript_3790/g.5477 Transcript_3790/m.5477 type:complete len:662 (+) Transcript_3790:40-2025(+)